MSAVYDAEEADQEAAERRRVAEWAADHQDPLTAALQRAETAERRAEEAQTSAAARALRQAAQDLFTPRLDSFGNGGAYAAHTVTRLLNERADRITAGEHHG
ncbi:hypothetical protein [Janibacter anophelis]|uniref:hypothetical protein n=1 Tax=Janibacter anophelis TaxID=319054 RepID=UPI000DEF9485|nr:hypothetical protein [Janibacter anophelis]